MARKTDHPLLVSAENGKLEGCARSQDCKIWGAGMLRFTNCDDESEFDAQVIFTTAGCETCNDLTITHGDLSKVVGSLSGVMLPEREHSIAWVQEQLEQPLIDVVQKFVPPSQED